MSYKNRIVSLRRFYEKTANPLKRSIVKQNSKISQIPICYLIKLKFSDYLVVLARYILQKPHLPSCSSFIVAIL